jgi:hypothetical protein
MYDSAAHKVKKEDRTFLSVKRPGNRGKGGQTFLSVKRPGNRGKGGQTFLSVGNGPGNVRQTRNANRQKMADSLSSSDEKCRMP